MDPGARKWTLTIVTGIVVGVAGAALKLALPGIAQSPAPVVSGQVIVNEQNGELLLIDPLGRQPPAAVALPPRLRTEQDRRRFDRATVAISPQSVWWDDRRHLFVAVTTDASAAGQPREMDSAISDYYGDGTPRDVRLVSNIEALDSAVVGPQGQVAISGDTLQSNGTRAGVLGRGGHQVVISHDAASPVSWRADGRQLAYACSIHDSSPQLCTYSLSRRSQQVHVFPGVDNVRDPVFAPHGDQIAMVATVAGTQDDAIVIVTPTTDTESIVDEDPRIKNYPAWSPSGAVVSFATPSALVFRVLTSGEEHSLALHASVTSVQWVASTRATFGVP